MLQGIDINQVKQYNASLKQYRDKAANINAQIEFTKKELNDLCSELTKELGVEVTEENVEQIYMEQVEKINNTLKSGNTVLAKIAEEEQKLAQPAQVQQTTGQPQPQQPQMQAQPAMQNTVSSPVPPVPVAPHIEADTTGLPTEDQVFNNSGIAGSVFGNGNITGGKIFSLGG